MTIQNNLAHYRQKRGFTAINLAREIGVSRQTIYAMETGTYVPNTLLALKLAQVLEVKVEDLFRLEDSEAPAHTEAVELLPSEQDAQPGLPVVMRCTDGRSGLVAGWSSWDAVQKRKTAGEGRAQLFYEGKHSEKIADYGM